MFDVNVLCLPCEDAAYCDDLFPGIGVRCKLGKAGAHSAGDGLRSAANPLRIIVDGVNSYGSTRPWLASADDGSQPGIIKLEDPPGNHAMPKPGLLTETRCPRGIAEATLQLLPSKTSAPTQPENMYPAEMIRQACKNFEKLYKLNEGEAIVE